MLPDMLSIGLVDSHLHLQDFGAGVDIRRLICGAADAGIAFLVDNGTSERDWCAVLDCAKEHKEIVPCLGLHPWFVSCRSDKWLLLLEELISLNSCGVGEIGLDKCAEDYNADEQEKVFVAQLDIARRWNRPAMLHCVRLWGRLVDILRHGPALPRGFLLHSYGGSADLVKLLLDLGAYFSFSGSILRNNYRHAREALLAVPMHRLLIESDAPNMLPPPEYRAMALMSADGTELNSPENLPRICEGIAELLGKPVEELRDILRQNAIRFFGDLIRTD